MNNGEALSKSYKEKNLNVFFDHECTNDYCSARNGHRVQATMWKSENNYKLYCASCGHEDSLTKEQLKEVKQKLTREKALANMEQYHKEKKGLTDERPARIEYDEYEYDDEYND